MLLLRRDRSRDFLPRSSAAPVADPIFRLRAPAATAAWLLHEGSLTDRMGRAHGRVQVAVTREGFGRPSAIEAQWLEVPDRGGWWLREITLSAGGSPRLRARTMVPPRARQLRSTLVGLGSTPLGTVLFHRDRLRPGVRRLQRGFYLTHDGGWVRATRYEVHGDPMLLFERLIHEAPPRPTTDGATRTVQSRAPALRPGQP